MRTEMARLASIQDQWRQCRGVGAAISRQSAARGSVLAASVQFDAGNDRNLARELRSMKV
jgi:hypothetical protein